LAFDPILAKCKLIAEAWDAGGLYQVGSFPAFGRWAEWNGKYRDIRKFLKEPGRVGDMAQRLQGHQTFMRRMVVGQRHRLIHHSPTVLRWLTWFRLRKHNRAGENNNDGTNDNDSWNWR